jgi:hypothetical protein
LAIDIGSDPEFHDDIEKLAASLSSGAQNVRERARETAEAELDLLRIRKLRAWLFETLYLADAALPDGLAELNESLAKLERYERRAFSRRHARDVALRLQLPRDAPDHLVAVFHSSINGMILSDAQKIKIVPIGIDRLKHFSFRK